jgi:CheY-like chemotaxis protein
MCRASRCPMLGPMPDPTSRPLETAPDNGAPLEDASATSRALAATDSRAVRLVIADADRRVRQSLAGLIGLADGFVLSGVAGDVASAIELVERTAPDAIVVDPRLPEIDAGLGFLAHLRSRYPALRIVAMNCSDSLEHPVLAVGASAFLEKQGGAADFIEQLRVATGPSAGVR